MPTIIAHGGMDTEESGVQGLCYTISWRPACATRNPASKKSKLILSKTKLGPGNWFGGFQEHLPPSLTDYPSSVPDTHTVKGEN